MMKNLCERFGGAFIVFVSAGMMAATMLLIRSGQCPAEIGFGFITAALLPMALGHQHHRRCRDLQEQIAATKADVRMSVAAHANDVRQHVTRVVGATYEKLDGLSAKLGARDASKYRRPAASGTVQISIDPNRSGSGISPVEKPAKPSDRKSGDAKR
jgi:hypothetical protein